MVLFILKAHGALHFGGSVDERSQRIARQRVIVAARVDILKFSRFVVTALGVGPGKEKPLDFVGGVERVAFFLVKSVGVALQDPANVGGVRRTVFVNHVTEDQDFAGTKHIGGRPIKKAPNPPPPPAALPPPPEAADRRALARQVIPALDETLLVPV